MVRLVDFAVLEASNELVYLHYIFILVGVRLDNLLAVADCLRDPVVHKVVLQCLRGVLNQGRPFKPWRYRPLVGVIA